MSSNPFVPRVKKDRGIKGITQYDQEQVVYNLIPKAVKVVNDDGVEEDVVRYEPVFVRKYNIAEYIESFSDEVGIRNILKKLSLSGDKSILNQTGRQALCPDGGLEPIQDYTNVPSSKAAAFNAVQAGVDAYDALPAEIKGKMSFDQFAQEFGQTQLDAYVASIKAKYAAQAAEGESK